MARRRVVDWRKLSQRYTQAGWQETLTWMGVLASVDDFGLCEWSPLRVGSVFMEREINAKKISVSQVANIMEAFAAGESPQIVTWEFDRRRYLAVIKHQDYQRIRLPGNADCPCPPTDILQKLSAVTRGLITDNSQKFTTVSGAQITESEGPTRARAVRQVGTSLPPLPSGVVEVEDEDEDEGRHPRKKPPDLQKLSAVCSWCANPTPIADEAKPGPQRLAQAYHDAYRQAHGECPVIGKADFANLSRLLKAGKPFERMLAVIKHGVRSEKPFLVDAGHKLTVILSDFQGIAQALDRGEVHGADRRQGGATAGRVSPQEPGDPADSGRVVIRRGVAP